MANETSPLPDEVHAHLQATYAAQVHIDGNTGIRFDTYQEYLDWRAKNPSADQKAQLRVSLAALESGLTGIDPKNTAAIEKQQAAIAEVKKQLE